MASHCDNVRGLLPGFLGEELGAGEMCDVRAHLVHCSDCRREAADFLQAQKALQRAAAARAGELQVDELPVDGTHVDGQPVEDLHGAILRRVAAEREAVEQSWPWTHRLMAAAAAVLLASFGFWLAGEMRTESIFDRRAMDADVSGAGGPLVGHSTGAGSALWAQPFAGPPADLQPVGFEDQGGGSVFYGFGAGMLGRDDRDLQNLVHSEFVLPVSGALGDERPADGR